MPPPIHAWAAKNRAKRPPDYVPPNADAADGTALRCNSWDYTTPESMRLRYNYPANLTSFFVRSYDSPKTSGSFEVWVDDTMHDGFEIQLQLRGRFGQGDGKYLDACMMQGAVDGEFGLGIYNVSRLD